jgi:hypothetical protein
MTSFYMPSSFGYGGGGLADVPAYNAVPAVAPAVATPQFNFPGGVVPTPPVRPADLGVDTSAGTPTSDQATQQGGLQGGLQSLLQNVGGLKGLLQLGGGLMGYLNAQKAQDQAKQVGQQIQQMYGKSAADLRQLAQPTYLAGTTQLEQAKQGILSPAQMQAYQAMQAQLAQTAAKTGGVGAIQTAAAEQRAYQQALQADYQTALSLLNVGDPLIESAIQAELQGSTLGLQTTLQYSQQANDAAAKLMMNLASMGAQTPQSQTNPGVQ